MRKPSERRWKGLAKCSQAEFAVGDLGSQCEVIVVLWPSSIVCFVPLGTEEHARMSDSCALTCT